MSDKASTSHLPYCTARLRSKLSDGGSSIGTGFFFRFTEAKDVYLITNLHVVEGAMLTEFDLPERPLQQWSNGCRWIDFAIKDPQARWVRHPDNKIDMCCCNVTEMLAENTAYYIPITTRAIPSYASLSDFPEVSEVLIVGYALDLMDRQYRRPLIRRGITASHPSLGFDWESRFIIDAACPPGSSGSPVFHLPDVHNSYDSILTPDPETQLLGILYSSAYYEKEGSVKLTNIPTQPSSLSDTPINLGGVIPSNCILDFRGA